jgi:predicted membrane protein (TIGR00267 family)
MNAFDGALTMLGVVIGAYVSGLINNPTIIISAGIAGSIAMGASGMSGAYMTEKAERTKKLKKLEKAMLSDMSNGLHGKSHRFATIFAAVVDGVSPAVAAMIVISPFFLVNFGVISAYAAFYSCIALTLAVLSLLGVYLARISDESMIKYGIQMLLVGLITAFICVGTSILLGGQIPV